MRPIFAALFVVPLLAGCNNASPPPVVVPAPGQMIGQNETDLVRQLGVPTRDFEADGHRFLAYMTRKVDITPATGPFAPFWGHWGGGSYGPDAGPAVVDYICETTYEISGGRVQSFQRRGNACG